MAKKKARSKKRTTRKTSPRKGVTRKSKARKGAARRRPAPARARSAAAGGAPPAAGRGRRGEKSEADLPVELLVQATPPDLHDADVEQALQSGDPRYREHLERLFGEALTEELKGLSRQAARTPLRGGPAALILPGIMGSKLGYERWPFDDTIWVDPIDIALGHLTKLSPKLTGKKIAALGVLLVSYLRMKLKLRLRGIDADFFPYDWRLDLRRAGEALAAHIQKEHASRGVYLVAHSMGGLVARRALRVLNDDGALGLVHHTIMLGTPNYGSLAPALVLRQCHGLTRKIAALDRKNDLEELVKRVFGRFEGLMQLLPSPQRSGSPDLLDAAAWPGPWAPEQRVLDAAKDLEDDLHVAAGRMTLVAGIDHPTFVSARIEESAFVFTRTRAGDGTVPLALAQIEGVPTLYSRAEHGSLANDAKVIDAVSDLIRSGKTAALPSKLPDFSQSKEEVREGDLVKRAPEFGGRRGLDVSPAEVRGVLEGFVTPAAPAAPSAVAAEGGEAAHVGSADWATLSDQVVDIGRKRQRTLEIRMALGDITQVDARAIVLGVFSGVEPSGAANAVDRYLEGAIRDLVEHDLLRGEVGQVFVLPASRRRLRAELVVFVGLGAMDRFDDSVRRVVARNVAHTLARARVDDVVTVLLGGGSGTDAGSALASMVAGFLEALREADTGENLRRVTICEHSRERYDSAVGHLRVMMTSALFDDVRIHFCCEELPPPLLPPSGWRGPGVLPEDPVYLITRQEPDVRKGGVVDVMRLSVLTADGNATVLAGDAVLDDAELDRKMAKLAQAANPKQALADLGRWLGEELLPRDVREGLHASRGRHLIVVHDGPTARIPWETLRIKQWTPATEKGLSRKLAAEGLAVGKWLASRTLGERLKVLLVVNPTLDLDGAELEGAMVRKALEAAGSIEVHTVEGREATKARVQEELRSGRYDVLHYAGHAFYDVEQRERSGILCHGDVVLSGGDLVGLESLPALAFINACESGRVRRRGPKPGPEKARKAGKPGTRNADSAERVRVKASLAEAFLRGGIASYIGTYWPVGDSAAESFAREFYGRVLRAETISDALVAARKVVEKESVDWADYIHYGTRTLKLREAQSQA